MAKTRYGCKFCGRWFTDPHAFGGHLNSHKGEDPKCKCDWCGSPFESALSLNAHKAHCQYGEPPKASPFLFCDVCKAPFKNAQGLGSHRRNCKATVPYNGCTAKKPKKPEPRKYILTYNGEIIEVGTEKRILERLKVDADMNELPENENDITIYVLDKMIKVKYDHQIRVKLGIGMPVK